MRRIRILVVLTAVGVPSWAAAQIAGSSPPTAGERPARSFAHGALPRLFPLPEEAVPVRAGPAETTGFGVRASGRARAHETRSGSAHEAHSRWRPALAASTVVAVTGALVAYWSTDAADAAYDRYLRSAGRSRQEASLERAERLDRVAGAAFAAMEAGLVLSAYFVFF